MAPQQRFLGWHVPPKHPVRGGWRITVLGAHERVLWAVTTVPHGTADLSGTRVVGSSE